MIKVSTYGDVRKDGKKVGYLTRTGSGRLQWRLFKITLRTPRESCQLVGEFEQREDGLKAAEAL